MSTEHWFALAIFPLYLTLCFGALWLLIWLSARVYSAVRGKRAVPREIDLEIGADYKPEPESGQPFLGVNGKHFLILFVAGFPIAAIASLLVYGDSPTGFDGCWNKRSKPIR